MGKWMNEWMDKWMDGWVNVVLVLCLFRVISLHEMIWNQILCHITSYFFICKRKYSTDIDVPPPPPPNKSHGQIMTFKAAHSQSLIPYVLTETLKHLSPGGAAEYYGLVSQPWKHMWMTRLMVRANRLNLPWFISGAVIGAGPFSSLSVSDRITFPLFLFVFLITLFL